MRLVVSTRRVEDLTPNPSKKKKWHKSSPCSLICLICFTVSLRMAHLSGLTLRSSMSLMLAKISSASSSMYLFSCSLLRLSVLRFGLQDSKEWCQNHELTSTGEKRTKWWKLSRQTSLYNAGHYIWKAFVFVNWPAFLWDKDLPGDPELTLWPLGDLTLMRHMTSVQRTEHHYDNFCVVTKLLSVKMNHNCFLPKVPLTAIHHLQKIWNNFKVLHIL